MMPCSDQSSAYLGERVWVSHLAPPNDSAFTYCVGSVLEEGRLLKAYLLTETLPAEPFLGRVIGLLLPVSGGALALVVAPVDQPLHQAKIAVRLPFLNEDGYHLLPLYHRSCGVIVWRKETKTEYLLLLQKASQTWSVPKGHAENRETDRETAERELWEETGLHMANSSSFETEVSYSLLSDPHQKKTVHLFLAQGEGSLSLRPDEIQAYRWVPADQAKAMLHPAYTPVIDQAEAFLQSTLDF